MKTRRLWALCRKESFQIVRDPSSILIAFVLPMILLFIYGYGINLDANRVRIGLLLQDDGAAATRFVATIAASPYFELSLGRSRPEMEARLKRGEIRGLLTIPADFSRKAAHGQAAIQVLSDGAEPNTANFVSAYAQGAWRAWLQQQAQDSGRPLPAAIELTPRYWFNPATVSRNYLVPGSISVIMTIIGALLTSLVVAREWERGTMEALLATPATRAELLLSKLLPYYLLGMAAMAVCVLVATQIMRVPLRGSLPMLWLVTSLFLGSALGLGLLLSSLLKRQFLAAQAALTAAFLPAVMLSGFVFEIASMPWPVQWFSYLIPARYFVSALQTLFQADGIDRPLLLDTGLLALSALFWLSLTALATRRRLE